MIAMLSSDELVIICLFAGQRREGGTSAQFFIYL